jgi:DNA-binding response OmpR family regulator
MERHILLIDDDVDEPEIFMNALTDANIPFRCTWANGADQAMAHLDTISPDIIVLDFNMPKTNGLELLQLLKQDAGLRSIPVIMYSATMDAELQAKAIRAGAVKCIRKPYNMQELPELLRSFL